MLLFYLDDVIAISPDFDSNLQRLEEVCQHVDARQTTVPPRPADEQPTTQ